MLLWFLYTLFTWAADELGVSLFLAFTINYMLYPIQSEKKLSYRVHLRQWKRVSMFEVLYFRAISFYCLFQCAQASNFRSVWCQCRHWEKFSRVGFIFKFCTLINSRQSCHASLRPSALSCPVIQESSIGLHTPTPEIKKKKTFPKYNQKMHFPLDFIKSAS